HQLLTHTAGTGDVFTTPEFRQAPGRFKSISDYLALIYAKPLVGKPGHEFHYSDSGYALLGAVVEKASGESYYDYVRRHIFHVAGMRDSGFDLIPRPINLATGYTNRDLSNPSYTPQAGTRFENSAILPATAAPGAGAYSTAEDLLHFANAILQH